MAFGFFKKQAVADIIFTNGRIYTQNPDQPWAEAVAVADGEIMAVGDAAEIMEDYEGDDTEIVDLEGGVMTPGLIDSEGHPVMKSFENLSFFMESYWDLQRCIEEFSHYAKKVPDQKTAFAYGYNEKLLMGLDPGETIKILDKVSEERPVAALSASGIHLWLNSRAVQIVRETAEEEEVEQINLSYILGVLMPVDPDELLEEVLNRADEYCKAGFTGVFDCGAPDYFLTLYQGELINMYQEDLYKQRFYGSLLVNRNVEPKSLAAKLMQNRTNCAELNYIINFNTLKLVVDRTGSQEAGIAAEAISELVMAAAERNFNVHADAVDESAAAEVMKAFDEVRSAGYKKNVLVLASDHQLSEKEKQEFLSVEDIITTPSTLGHRDGYSAIEGAETMEEALDRLTVQAAETLGAGEKLGSIEIGKYADFTIFNEDPFKCKVTDFGNLDVAMTVISGTIVYDSEEDDSRSWYELLSQQQY